MNRLTHWFYDLVIGLFDVLVRRLFPSSKMGLWATQRSHSYTKNPVGYHQHEVVFFCSSHGEFEMIYELIKRIRLEQPWCYIHLLFFSNSGYRFVVNETWAYDKISIAPLDKMSSLDSFFHDQNPKLLVISANAIWPSLIKYFKKRALPYLFVNSSFDGGQKWAKDLYFQLMKSYLRGAQNIYVDNDASLKYLESIGIKDVRPILNLRWEALLAYRKDIQPIDSLNWLKDSSQKVLVCGSTYSEDEDIIAKAIKDLTEWTILIAPHKVDQNRINQIQEKFPNAQLLSELKGQLNSTVIVIDQIGLLKSLYQYADASYIGGAFNNALHNVLEPAVWEIPVIYSQLATKKAEVKAIQSCGQGIHIVNGNELAQTLQSLHNISMTPCYAESDFPSGIPLIIEDIRSIA